MENTLFFHGKTTDNHRFTLAGQFVKKGVVIKNNFINLGATICNPKDPFVKKVGRLKAESRINVKGNKGKMFIPVKIKKGSEIKVFMNIATTFMEGSSKDFQKKFNLYKKNNE